jgi:hypothetical protein
MPERSCDFRAEVTLATFLGPPRYQAFLEGVRDKRRLYSIRERGVWTTLVNRDGRAVVPFWLSRDGARECVAREWPGLGVAPVAISRLVDEWLNGWLPREVRAAVGVESSTQGVLVEQHRLLANLFEVVDYLPYYRPQRRHGQRGFVEEIE